ncbi:hypothetical protein ACERIT_08395 [Halopenitus sp. H-Gu1]|uniref:hypothetical protein n=1 Tax=Halopenitus sp. H-Gu1 TaxID=3242697 RepID=UPI00359EA271
MDLTAETIDALASTYRDREPFYPVEREQQETLPDVLRSGEFGRRDVEWVVRWYFRRHLGDQSHAERRAIEERFANNPFGDVLDAITAAAADAHDDDPETALRRLTSLDGVDVPIASAFLAFIDPDAYVVCGEREWEALHEIDRLERRYPDPPTIDEYGDYLSACLSIVEETGHEPWTVHRALWRLSADDRGGQ